MFVTWLALAFCCQRSHFFVSSQEIIDKTARSAGKRALCMGGAMNHLIAMPDCDEVGLQEYRNKNLEKSVGFVHPFLKGSNNDTKVGLLSKI